DFTKAFWTCVLTVAGIGFVLFLAFLGMNLSEQVVMFVNEIITELLYRTCFWIGGQVSGFALESRPFDMHCPLPDDGRGSAGPSSAGRSYRKPGGGKPGRGEPGPGEPVAREPRGV